MTTDTTTTPVSTEEQDAEAALARLRPELVTDQLCVAVMAAAKASVFCAAIEAERSRAEQALEAAVALAQHDLEAGATHTMAADARLRALDLIAKSAPPSSLDPALALNGVVIARARLAGVRVIKVTEINFDLELAQYRALAIADVQACDPPELLTTDQTARDARNALCREAQKVADAVTQWDTLASTPGATDPLSILASASDLIGKLEELEPTVEGVDRQILNANEIRFKRGKTWTPPKP